MENTNAPVYLIGNAHIDPVWLWRWQEGFAEIKATFASALERMEEFPNYIFTSACASYYEWVEENDPEMFEAIRRRIDEGRWTIAGGMAVQPDCNLPCLESFSRHMLYSQRYFKEKFGRMAITGYNVDSFGHNGMLPQLVKKGGMDNYVFMRPGVHENDGLTHAFNWRSPDGSEVLAIRIPFSYGDWSTGAEDNEKYRDMHPSEIKIREALHLSEEAGYPLMCFYGVGNHGGGPTIKSLKAIDSAINAGLPAEYSDPDGYSEALRSWGADFPSYTGDLQHHASGCYAANSQIKAINAHAEARLYSAEALSVLSRALTGREYTQDELKRLWKIIGFNQFHDILAGCSIKEAYDDAYEALGEVLSASGRAQNAAMQKISWLIDTSGGQRVPKSKENDFAVWEYDNLGVPVVVFNTSGRRLTAPVKVNRLFASICDDQGQPVASQKTRGPYTYTNIENKYNTLFEAEVPALGYRVYRAFLKKEPVDIASPLTYGEHFLENGFIRAEFDGKTGLITRLVDKSACTELISPDRPAGRGVVVDETHCDTWAHNVFEFRDDMGELECGSVELVEAGPVSATVRVRSRYGGSEMTLDYSLSASSPMLTCRARFHWREKHRQLRLTFPLNSQLESPTAVYGMPGGHIRKPADGLEEPAQRFAAVEGRTNTGTAALAFVCQTRYSYNVKGHELRVCALRSPLFADHYGVRDGEGYYTDQGELEFDFALIPAPDGDYTSAEAAFDILSQKLAHIVETYHSGPLPLAYEGLTLSSPAATVTAVKRAEDDGGYILRLVNTSSQPLETVRADFALIGRRLEFAMAPMEIKTFYLPDGDASHREVNLLEM